jgi:hypothetical protein
MTTPTTRQQKVRAVLLLAGVGALIWVIHEKNRQQFVDVRREQMGTEIRNCGMDRDCVQRAMARYRGADWDVERAQSAALSQANEAARQQELRQNWSYLWT